VPADRPRLTAAGCRVSCKTSDEVPGQGATTGTPEDARISGRSERVAGRLRGPASDEEQQRRQPVLSRLLPRHSVDAPTQPRCVASHGLRFRNRLEDSSDVRRGGPRGISSSSRNKTLLSSLTTGSRGISACASRRTRRGRRCGSGDVVSPGCVGGSSQRPERTTQGRMTAVGRGVAPAGRWLTVGGV
jgi:hypothetical protein